MGSLQIYVVVTIIFLLQILIVYSYYFRTGWDVNEIIQSAYLYAKGNNDEIAVWYFSTYPNNVILLKILGLIFRFFIIIGLEKYSYFLTIILAIATVMISSLFLFKITNYIFKNEKVAWILYWIFTGLITISPWLSIPYTDTIGMIFPILMLNLYIFMKKESFKFCILGFLFIFALSLKPQTAIAGIAIVLYELLFNEKRVKRKAVNLVVFVAMAFVSTQALNTFNQDVTSLLNK